MKLEACNIFYESWQIQCCGKPFKVGDRVTWSYECNCEDLTIGDYKIDFVEDHHGHATHTIIGTITGIAAVVEHRLSEGKSNYENELTLLQEADGRETDILYRNDNSRYFSGYIVSMKDVEVTEYNKDLKYDYD